MLKFFYSVFILLGSINIVGAEIHFKNVQFNKINSTRGQLKASFDNDVVEIPRLKFEDRKIHLFVPGTKINSKIVRKMPLGSNAKITVVGKQSPREGSHISMSLPYSIKTMKKKIHVNLKGKKVYIDFPLVKLKPKKISKIDSKNVYDESYLQKLIDEKNAKSDAKNEKAMGLDIVKKSLSSSVPKEQKTFSLGKQIGKFTIFLTLVLAIFYGIVLFIKKSVLSKSKLGFLNSTKIVEVINTTYIAPKRSVMLVRAHKQVFLIGNSEKGFHSLGELTDVTGLLKEGEKAISGNNFDTSLQSASRENKEFSLKESMKIEEFKNQEKNINLSAQIKNISLSEQIKSKVKGLKALQ